MNEWNRSHPFARLNWAIIVFLYIAWWPAGLVLTVLKLIDQKQLEKDDQTRRNWVSHMNGWNPAAWNPAQNTAQSAPPFGYTGTWAPQSGTYTGQAAAPGQPSAPGQPAAPARAGAFRAAPPAFSGPAASPDAPSPEQQQAKKSQTVLAIVLAVLAAVFIFMGLPDLNRFFEGIFYGYFDPYMLRYFLLPGLAKVLGGIGLGFYSSHLRIGMRREKLLATIVGARSCVTLQELSAASGYSVKKTAAVLKDAIAHGLFGAGAYVDVASRSLVVRGVAPRAQAAAAAPQPAPVQKPAADSAVPAADETKYQAILRQLRELNDEIPGEEMSAKIDQLEQISARIFALAESDPKKLPQLNRFMDYYLPTALKLLSTYATLDAQCVGGQNITETKASIENAMDLLIKAFSAQLDKLFQSDALDVSGDIAALQGMMHLDGLAGGEDFPASAAQPGDGKETEL